MPIFIVGALVGGVFSFATSGAVKETASAGKYIAVATMVFIGYRFSKDAGWIGK